MFYWKKKNGQNRLEYSLLPRVPYDDSAVRLKTTRFGRRRRGIAAVRDRHGTVARRCGGSGRPKNRLHRRPRRVRVWLWPSIRPVATRVRRVFCACGPRRCVVVVVVVVYEIIIIVPNDIGNAREIVIFGGRDGFGCLFSDRTRLIQFFVLGFAVQSSRSGCVFACTRTFSGTVKRYIFLPAIRTRVFALSWCGDRLRNPSLNRKHPALSNHEDSPVRFRRLLQFIRSVSFFVFTSKCIFVYYNLFINPFSSCRPLKFKRTCSMLYPQNEKKPIRIGTVYRYEFITIFLLSGWILRVRCVGTE